MPNRDNPLISFRKLIELHSIEIPLLQRDYAQGRTHQGTVRAEFLEALSSEEPLELDFIFGSTGLGEDGQAVFELIDGQQRLTTVFLLHWYLHWKEGKVAEFAAWMCAHGKLRFRYQVRPSSNTFFHSLLEVVTSEPGMGKPRAWLEDQTWFRSAWLHDSTVSGALVMLDAMHDSFQVEGTRTIGQLSGITFQCFDLRAHELTDEIYLKMNDRGQPLTGFEKFKAWLIGKGWVTEEQQQMLDNDWLEMFWAAEDPSDDRASLVSATFFRSMTALAINRQALAGAFKSKEKGKWLEADTIGSPIVWEALFTENILAAVFEDLVALHAARCNATDYRGRTLSLLKAASHEKPNFAGRLWLLALTMGIKDKEAYRVLWNLLKQSDIDLESFGNAAASVQTIASQTDLLTFMIQGGGSALKAFPKEQIQEETHKALLLHSDAESRWRMLFDAAEPHAVLSGQIALLLEDNHGNLADDLNQAEHRWTRFQPQVWKGGDGFSTVRDSLAMAGEIELTWWGAIHLPDSESDWQEILQRQREGPRSLFRSGFRRLLDATANRTEAELKTWCYHGEPKTEKLWIEDLMQHGAHLLCWTEHKWRSRDKKIKNYSGRIYVFAKNNRGEHDIELANSSTRGTIDELKARNPVLGEEINARLIACENGIYFLKGTYP